MRKISFSFNEVFPHRVYGVMEVGGCFESTNPRNDRHTDGPSSREFNGTSSTIRPTDNISLMKL